MPWLRPIDCWLLQEILPHEPRLLDQARRWVGREEEARALVQQVYLHLLTLPYWASIVDPAAHASRALRSAALARMRRQRIVSIAQWTACEAEAPVDDASASPAQTDGWEELRRLEAALSALPLACRHVLTLRKIKRLSCAQIAAQLGRSQARVEKQLARGLVRLAAALARARAGAAAPPDPAPGRLAR
ncbi:RNA polymerase sigma factor [Sphingomonas morindae]|uniref:Sigma-70 family RNA polymerase sigma factor n=1 Tax=Sphingomonas morindae TaxID=1541170 RepID=A0ABY4X7W0_9SPHN|nr:sigma-70 family RNA polymerase sigma factor [Sphingomonas morindae]USI72756.1 sigma-70 family RNA polymerase sigma factor [Sphingomonas morindae]